MQKFLRVFLASVHIAAALTIVVNQAETAGSDLVRSAAAGVTQLSFHADLHGGCDPHFSHARKIGKDFAFSQVPALNFVVVESVLPVRIFSSDSLPVQLNLPARSPPLV